jgi:hypothetical protein
MSGYVVGLTFRRLPFESHTILLVALALAEQADGEGNGIYPSIDLVGTETRLSRRAVQYSIDALHAAGFLVLVKAATGRGQTNHWRIDLDWLDGHPDRVVAMRHEKALEKQVNKKGAPRAPHAPVDNPAEPPPRKRAKSVQKACKKGAPAGAHNPPTLPPVSTPPPVPLEELVEAALWDAQRHGKTIRTPWRYASTVRARLQAKTEQIDIDLWQHWLRHKEEQAQRNALAA